MPIKSLYVSLLLLVMVLTAGSLRAQDSEIITVTGMYSSYTQGEYLEILTPCDSLEVWDIATNTSAFTALAQVYDSLDATQLVKDTELFVELRGRYSAYEGESHSDGLFVITEFVRHSTAAADSTACKANLPASPDLVDGQCGSTRNSCVTGDPFDHEEGSTEDTDTDYRWVCIGRYGGDISACTAPKVEGHVDVVSRLRGSLTLYGWAYNTATPTATVPVEIYVGGALGTGTLVETVMADQPRADVNLKLSISGDHGFEWVVPAQYQSGAQAFYVYAVDQIQNPGVRRHLPNSPLPLLAVGTEAYCTDHGPCEVGHGDCDSTSECQSGLTCGDNVGANYGFAANIDVCEAGAAASLRGTADVVSRLHGPLTLYGWAYNTLAASAPIPVEIYVGGRRARVRWPRP